MMDKYHIDRALRNILPLDIECLQADPPFIPVRAVHEAMQRVMQYGRSIADMVPASSRAKIISDATHMVADEVTDMLKAAWETKEKPPKAGDRRIAKALEIFREIWPGEPQHEAARRLLRVLEGER